MFHFNLYFCRKHSTLFQQIATYIQKQFSLDARALAWMRVCLGFVVLADWLIRLSSLTAHYTNAGVMPTSAIFDRQWKQGFYSFFILSDALWWQYFLFFVAIVFTVFFILGYFTRFSNFVVWTLLCSIHARNPFILQGGDELLRIALFWSLFLPLGKKYSVDSKQLIEEERTFNVFSAGSIGFMILVFSVYFFSAILKTSTEWRGEGTAIYYALSLDQMVLPLGKVLLQFPLLCKVLTHFVFWTEVLAPCLFFIPFKNNLFRTTGVILLIAMHIGIGMTLFVGLFFLIGISTLIGMLPSSAVDKLLVKIPVGLRNVRILSFFAKILPSVSSLRSVCAKSMKALTNFYTETILTFALIFVICVCIIWNLGNIPGMGLTVSGPFRKMVYFLRIDQNWGMFSPGVFKDDGWFVLEGTLADKKRIDIYKGGSVSSAKKPDKILKYIKDDRWRKYEENYIMIDNTYIRSYYCRYLINKWNEEHADSKIDSLQIIYMKERTLPDYKVSAATREVLCSCAK